MYVGPKLIRVWTSLFALLLLPALALAQVRPADDLSNTWNPAGRPGVGVDARGGQVVDPTKNVLDLVEAAIRRQDDLRLAEAKFQDALRGAEARFGAAMRDADARRLNELRDAETRRINELTSQKQIFDLELARVIRANVESSTLLLATQVKEVKTDLSDRTAKLEQFRWESGGRTSATDPVYVDLLKEVKALSLARSDLSGRSTGQGEVVAYIFAAIMAVVGIVGLVLTFSNRHAPSRRTS